MMIVIMMRLGFMPISLDKEGKSIENGFLLLSGIRQPRTNMKRYFNNGFGGSSMPDLPVSCF